MRVVGVGCAPGLMTEEARETLEGAEEIYGSERALELAGEPDGGRAVEDWTALDELPGDAVLLSTGDPSFSGLAPYGDEVVPGISSFQLGCARLGIPVEGTAAMTAHGREVDEEVRGRVESIFDLGMNVFLLPGGFSEGDLSEVAEGYGFETVVLERLGYPDERITEPGGRHREPFSAAAGPEVEAPGE